MMGFGSMKRLGTLHAVHSKKVWESCNTRCLLLVQLNKSNSYHVTRRLLNATMKRGFEYRHMARRVLLPTTLAYKRSEIGAFGSGAELLTRPQEAFSSGADPIRKCGTRVRMRRMYAPVDGKSPVIASS
jgi:hypothetical protein